MQQFIFLFICLFVSLDGYETVKEIKLFDVVNLTTAKNVTAVTGNNTSSPAYKFGSETTNLIASGEASKLFAKQAFEIKDFTVEAYLKARPRIGVQMAIVSFSRGTNDEFSVLFR